MGVIVLVGNGPLRSQEMTDFIDSADVVIRCKFKSHGVLGHKTDIVVFESIDPPVYNFDIQAQKIQYFKRVLNKKWMKEPTKYYIFQKNKNLCGICEYSKLFPNNWTQITNVSSDINTNPPLTIGFKTLLWLLYDKPYPEHEIWLINFTWEGIGCLPCHDWVMEKQFCLDLEKNGKINIYR
jgi:hypothetical protein